MVMWRLRLRDLGSLWVRDIVESGVMVGFSWERGAFLGSGRVTPVYSDL